MEISHSGVSVGVHVSKIELDNNKITSLALIFVQLYLVCV